MRYLRVLTNAAIAGTLLSAYFTIAMLHLNPAFPLSAAAPLAAAFFLTHGVVSVGVFCALVVLRQVAAVQELSPGWLSVRVLAWMCTIAAAVGAGVLWLNGADFAPFLDADTARRTSLAALAVAICGGVFLIVALAHIGRRGTAPSGALLVTTMALSVAVPLALRGPSPAPSPVTVPAENRQPLGDDVPGSRVVLLAIDGASLDHISLSVAGGRLPNFGRLLDRGASAYLATLRPTQAEPIWTSVATGRLPQTSGVRSAMRYSFGSGRPRLEVLPDYVFSQALVSAGLLRVEPHGPASMASLPLWHILSRRGVRVGVVGWPLTHPPEAIRGYVVSDLAHRLDSAAVSPPSLAPVMAAARAAPLDPDPYALFSAARSLPAGTGIEGRMDTGPAADALHLRLLDTLEGAQPSRLAAYRLPGLDAVVHYYLRYASPEAFGDVSAAERAAFGAVIDDYYGVLDAAVGRLHASLGPDDLLLVVSGHGMEPLTPLKRVLERLVGDAELSGTHERAPDGFVIAAGGVVEAGRLERGSIVDIAPTVLYFLGLPIAREMDGRARTDVFRGSFTATRPVTFIPSYGR